MDIECQQFEEISSKHSAAYENKTLGDENKIVRNSKIVCGVFIVLLFMLALRLTFLAVVEREAFTLAAETQRTEFLPSSSAFRGVIYSRDMFPLSSSSLSPHILGYVNAAGEGMGLQKAFNNYLTAPRSGFAVETAANRKPISGLGIMVIGRTRKGIKTAIDHEIQRICEDVLESRILRGACVVVNSKTGDILAIASTPKFQDVSTSLAGNNGELINRAISAYDVGSLFKIVTAAAALESGVAIGNYTCNGHMEIAGRDFLCNNTSGHGILTLSHGFALSCNIPFFTLGQELGTANINALARKFGFGATCLDIGESAGSLEQNGDAQSAANMSIGQGGLSATPLQIADMLATIVNGGKRTPLRLVSDYVADNGIELEPISQKPSTQVVSTKTAGAIKNMMISAVENGTGQNAQINGVAVGGKTSSAETGWLSENGELMVHGWFGGFFKDYVCVVLAEDGKSGASAAAPCFKEIGEKILALTK